MEVKQVCKTKQTYQKTCERNVIENWLLGGGTGGGETHLWFVEVPDTLNS